MVMAVLSQQRASVVRALIEAAPDSAVQSLDAALSGEAAGGSLSSVKAIVSAEMQDRALRDAVFEPLAPLFAPRQDGFDQLMFPRPAFSRMWRALKALQPDEIAFAAALPPRRYDSDEPPPVYDELCRLAAQALRVGEGEFAALAELLKNFRPGGDVELLACLDLAPIARNALRQLPGWLARMTDERQAVARLMFKDAVALSDDAGPRLLEILFAHLAEPWTILRIMSAVMLKPGDRYASSSELADFGVRLLRDIDRRAAQIKGFDYNAGAEAGREAAEALRIAAAVAAEFEQSLVMNRDGPWGERLAKQKQALAASAEGHLRKLEKTVAAALPMQPVRINGRAMGSEPRLESPPDAAAVRRAQALLAFFSGIRSTAAQSGYGSIRAKVQEETSHGLDTYLEELLAILHSGECEHMDNARLYLEVVAEFIGLMHDEQAAQIVRRRAAAA
jgi:hypothetical protein